MLTHRRETGQRLLNRLGKLDPQNTVILALPRGGLPVADVIAQALGAPLDVVLVRKVGVPGQPEFAVAAVTDGKTPKITVKEDVARIARRSPQSTRPRQAHAAGSGHRDDDMQRVRARRAAQMMLHLAQMGALIRASRKRR